MTGARVWLLRLSPAPAWRWLHQPQTAHETLSTARASCPRFFHAAQAPRLLYIAPPATHTLALPYAILTFANPHTRRHEHEVPVHGRLAPQRWRRARRAGPPARAEQLQPIHPRQHPRVPKPLRRNRSQEDAARQARRHRRGQDPRLPHPHIQQLARTLWRRRDQQGIPRLRRNRRAQEAHRRVLHQARRVGHLVCHRELAALPRAQGLHHAVPEPAGGGQDPQDPARARHHEAGAAPDHGEHVGEG